MFAIFTQTFTTRRVAAKFKEPQVLRISLFGVSCVMFAYLLAPSPLWLFLIAPISSTFNGLSLANMGGLLSRSVAPQVQGEILGIGTSIAALANSLPPLVGALGFFAGVTPAAPVFAAAFTMLCAWLIFTSLWRPVQVAARAVNV